MVVATRIVWGLLPLWLLVVTASAHDGRTEDPSDGSHVTASTATVCEARTINYITHTLPQLCLTSAWKSDRHSQDETPAPVPATPNANPDGGNTSPTAPTATDTSTTNTGASETSADAAPEAPPGDPVASPFMSFEDWKEMMLRRTGQDPQDLRSRKATDSQEGQRVPPDMGHFGLGEEDEISLDFESYLDKSGHDRPIAVVPTKDGAVQDHLDDAVVYEGDAPFLHRSKDAGKTCKERFSYSSFDAGATILKTGRGTKNAKAILVENKDSYMLLECAVESKYVIVELSDDILVDTVVLANFEFFSSMIRHFRLSVSDRYPVKPDRWSDIGTFEARNSRDIQAFLVENPQIWAKYVRIDFLSYYGNEFYCPISLLRIHGSRMLDSWKDTEITHEDEILLEADGERDAINRGDAVPKNTSLPTGEALEAHAMMALGFTPWATSLSSFLSNKTCQPGEVLPEDISSNYPNKGTHQPSQREQRESAGGEAGAQNEPAASAYMKRQGHHQGHDQDEIPAATPTASSPPSGAMHEPHTTVIQNSTSVNSTWTGEAATEPSTTKASTPVSPGIKPRNIGTNSAPSASPTVQEGFFNAVTKRLHNVESNLTLSLQYLEDQSRYMQEALQKAEQKQLSKVTVFLENLNQTVFAELRGMHDQYDQIWQSTVIALESQKEQYERDIVALSSRLNLLADEVVFQKRMAIVQAVLLLCCLFLVIFSRGVPIPYLAPLLDQNSAASYSTLKTPQMQPYGLLRGGHGSSRGNGVHPRSHDLADYIQPASTSVALGGDITKREEPSSNDTDGSSATRTHNELPHQGRLSPPLTPSLQADTSLPEPTGFSYDLQPPSSRRLSNFQHNQCRKPLPALPEHPSPERSSPSRASNARP